VLGTALAIVLPSVVDALTAFYGLLTVVLMVPLLAGLYFRSPGAAAALVTMASSVAVMLVSHFATGGKGIGILNPVAVGIAAGAAVMAIAVSMKGWLRGRHISS
jgi:SSS family solute:Na+ symporter